MKKQEFELELEKMCEQIFFKEELLEYINVRKSYIQHFSKALMKELGCNVLMGGPDSGIFGNIPLQTRKQVNWIEVYAGTKAIVELKNIYGQKRYLSVSTSKLSHMVAMSDESDFTLLLNDVLRPGFVAGIDFDFLRYKGAASITISKSRARAAQKHGGAIFENVLLIHNLGTSDCKSYDYRPDLKCNSINLAVDYRHYNIILNIESSGEESTVRKLYLSRGANLRNYFEKEGSIDIYHMDIKRSPHYDENLSLDKFDGVYLSWRPHIVDKYLIEEAQNHPKFPHFPSYEDDGGEEAA
ncbi:hypothetical protein M902_2278 [Bacteriovorax sp. BAL6_X]|uniref:hypothetical protein n=1 Tax=Bacteriovorax sp. BAL6_X TaxID=1201290 RepID=UPI000385954D|nr:hypothetical protein [Bacteriovorax sp. BAL6_X]EPZ52021.1 hypothetical protein M902_2278 [Bacteriovorax sp. BAL6_X]